MSQIESFDLDLIDDTFTTIEIWLDCFISNKLLDYKYSWVELNPKGDFKVKECGNTNDSVL